MPYVDAPQLDKNYGAKVRIVGEPHSFDAYYVGMHEGDHIVTTDSQPVIDEGLRLNGYPPDPEIKEIVVFVELDNNDSLVWVEQPPQEAAAPFEFIWKDDDLFFGKDPQPLTARLMAAAGKFAPLGIRVFPLTEEMTERGLLIPKYDFIVRVAFTYPSEMGRVLIVNELKRAGVWNLCAFETGVIQSEPDLPFDIFTVEYSDHDENTNQ